MVAADLLALGLFAAVSLICVGLGWLLPRLAPRGEESDVPEGDGPDYYALDVPPRLRESRQILRAALPSPPVAELVDDYYGTRVIQTRRDVRDALDAVLEDPAETNRRLREIRDRCPDLSELPAQLEDLYVIEVDS